MDAFLKCHYHIICVREQARVISQNMKTIMRNVSWFQEHVRYCSRILNDRFNIRMHKTRVHPESNIIAISS